MNRLFICLVIALATAAPTQAQEGHPAACLIEIKITVWPAGLEGRDPESSAHKIEGGGFLVSKEGHVVTCKHVASPVDKIYECLNRKYLNALYSNEGLVAINRIAFSITVLTGTGQEFTTTYEPDFVIEPTDDLDTPTFLIRQQEKRDLADTDRELHIVSVGTSDIMLLKLHSACPLPYLTWSDTPVIYRRNDPKKMTRVQSAVVSRLDDARRYMTGRNAGYVLGDQQKDLKISGLASYDVRMFSRKGHSGYPVLNESDDKLAGMIWGHDPIWPGSRVASITFVAKPIAVRPFVKAAIAKPNFDSRRIVNLNP
ncbi:hypothetical protein CL628_03970 [bacterium]|nr:hypothetical protein [bacterium]|tara:strand:+ start:262 stop:1200 length:939 start_codon:yes stop_codon:yes gene_type:complete